MSKYWILCANNNVKDLTALNEMPKEITLSEWLSGEEVTISEKKILIDDKTISGKFSGHIWYSKIAAYHTELLEMLEEFGVKNIQTQAIERLKADGSITKSGYLIVNIVGLKQCVKDYDINSPQKNGPELFEIDESKTDGLDIFRLAENPNLIVISDKLKEHIDSWETSGVSFIATDEYVRADTLLRDELALSKELGELTGKRNYSEEILARVEELLENGADANYKTSDWSSKPPIVQVLNSWEKVNKRAMLELLVKWGAAVNRPDDHKYPIKTAAHDGNIDDVTFLIENGAVDGYADALNDAIEQNHLDVVKFFVEKGVDVNSPCALDMCSQTYHYKHKEGSEGPVAGYEIAEYLISKGANVNGVGEFEGKPLHGAISHECIELVELFVNNGLKVVESKLNNLSIAKSAKMINYLVKIGFDPHKRDDTYNTTYLMDPIFWGEKELFKAFLKFDIDLYAVDYQGKTAFHNGVRSEQLAIVKYLLTIYDIKKVHNMKSVLGIADNPRIDALLKEELTKSGVDISVEIEDKEPEIDGGSDPVIADFDNPEFKALQALKAQTREELCTAHPDIEPRLNDIDSINSKALFNKLYIEMERNLENWRTDVILDRSIITNVINLEYAGAITDPFDGAALLNCFANYTAPTESDLPYSIGDPVADAEEKSLSLQFYFDGIDELCSEFSNSSNLIQEYYKYHAFMQLHGIFHKLDENGRISLLPHNEPILLFGRAHDEDPVVIYKVV